MCVPFFWLLETNCIYYTKSVKKREDIGMVAGYCVKPLEQARETQLHMVLSIFPFSQNTRCGDGVMYT